MLRIIVPANEKTKEYWDEAKEEFVYIPSGKEEVLRLEHSLVSLSKWEAKWCKPFFANEEKTDEEVIDYIRCMTLNKDVKPEVYQRLTNDNIIEIKDYILAPMTATTFSETNTGSSKEMITSELIYYWMVSLKIPVEFEKWHLNRLLTLIRVCEVKNRPPKKKSKQAMANEYAALNAARRKKFNSRG